MKRLVLFVEGEGDALAVPILVKRLLTELDAWDCLFLDPHTFVTKGVNRLVKDGCRNWLRWLGAAALRGQLGAVLLVLDGDLFSVAVVFACREYESWLIAGVESLSGKRLMGGLAGVRAGTHPPEGDLEASLRDAKGWLKKVMESGYKERRDQGADRNRRPGRRAPSADALVSATRIGHCHGGGCNTQWVARREPPLTCGPGAVDCTQRRERDQLAPMPSSGTPARNGRHDSGHGPLGCQGEWRNPGCHHFNCAA